MTLTELVHYADVIVVAKVESINKSFFGKTIAKAHVVDVWKGSPKGAVEFLAEPTWTCDISGATKGELEVLFLVKDKSNTFVIAYAGRGNMPVRKVEGKDYATYWKDVVFPKGTVSIAGPEKDYSFIRSIEVERLKKLVQADMFYLKVDVNSKSPQFFTVVVEGTPDKKTMYIEGPFEPVGESNDAYLLDRERQHLVFMKKIGNRNYKIGAVTIGRKGDPVLDSDFSGKICEALFKAGEDIKSNCGAICLLGDTRRGLDFVYATGQEKTTFGFEAEIDGESVTINKRLIRKGKAEE